MIARKTIRIILSFLLIFISANPIFTQTIDSTQFITNKLTTVKSDNHRLINPGLITNFSQLISGKFAGLQAFSTDGSIFSTSNLISRGTSTVIYPNNALVVVDGVPLDNNISDYFLNQIRPDDIESIQMVNDPIFNFEIAGAISNNGLIVVNTKKSKGGKLKIDFRTTNALQQLTKTANMLNASQFRQLITETANVNLIGLMGSESTNWIRQIFTTAPATDNHISISGELVKDLPFRFSGNYLNQTGILKPEHTNQYQYSLQLNPSLLNGYLQLNLTLSGSLSDNRQTNSSYLIANAYNMDPTQSTEKIYDNVYYYEPRNPLSILNTNDYLATIKTIHYQADADYKVHFLPDLHLKFRISDYSFSDIENHFSPINTIENYGHGYKSENFNQRSVNQTYWGLKYSKKISKHQFGLDAGLMLKSRLASGRKYSQGMDGYHPDSSWFNSEYHSRSTYETASYNYDYTYFITIGAFQNAYTKFHPNIQLAWNIKNQDFLKSSSFFQSLSTRISYTNTNETNIESIRMWNGGFDFSILKNKLAGSIYIYQRNTDNFIMYVSSVNRIIPVLGSLQSNGTELTLNSNLIETNLLKWNLGLNATYQKTFVKSFDNNGIFILSDFLWLKYLVKQGYEPRLFEVYEQKYDVNGHFIEFNGLGKLNAIHSPSPKYLFGLNSNLIWRKWSSDVSFRANLGNYVYNGQSAISGFFYSPTNNLRYLSNINADYFNTLSKQYNYLSDYYVQNASFLKMEYVNISYDFGRISKDLALKLSATVQNVFTITAYKGVEPEILNGIDLNYYPHPRVYSLSVCIGI